MPLVAQTVTAALAEAPSVRAGPWEWIASGTSIVYDNVLLAGEDFEVEARWKRLMDRCGTANVVVGDTQPPCTRLTSCGVEFDLTNPDDRCWRLSPSWCTRAASWLDGHYRPGVARDREVLAGLAQWALSASMLPLALASATIRGADDPFERLSLLTLLQSQPWRRLRGVPTRSLPESAVVVVTDGSVNGAGVVRGGRAYAIPWASRRMMEEQQDCELIAAELGIGHATDSANADEPSRSPRGSWPVAWPHPLEREWRSSALLACWSMANPIAPLDPSTASR